MGKLPSDKSCRNGRCCFRWLGSVEDLSEIVQRLLRVQIENSPAIDVIKRYDSEETLFYCDPPYPHDSRGDSKAYAYEMKDEDHRQLANVLRNVKGKVALSSYHCDLMDELYSDWHYIEGPIKNCHSIKKPRTEVLWVNYQLEEVIECQHQQQSLTPLFNELSSFFALIPSSTDAVFRGIPGTCT